MWFVPLTNPMSSVSSKSIDPGVRIGHVHLKVANLERAIGFYHGVLGFDVVLQYGGEAAFLSAGGYHHHIGVNIWAGKAAPPANSVGLVSYRLEVPITEILYCLGHRAPLLGYETRPGPEEEGSPILQIRDPNGNWLEVVASRRRTLSPFDHELK